MPDIRHRVVMSAPLDRVYSAIATRDGLSNWWTRDGVRGDSKEGSALEFYFGQPEPAAVMEVTRLNPEGQVSWDCIGGADEWVGTKLNFSSPRTTMRPWCCSPTQTGGTKATSWPIAARGGPTSFSASRASSKPVREPLLPRTSSSEAGGQANRGGRLQGSG